MALFVWVLFLVNTFLFKLDCIVVFLANSDKRNRGVFPSCSFARDLCVEPTGEAWESSDRSSLSHLWILIGFGVNYLHLNSVVLKSSWSPICQCYAVMIISCTCLPLAASRCHILHIIVIAYCLHVFAYFSFHFLVGRSSLQRSVNFETPQNLSQNSFIPQTFDEWLKRYWSI